MATSSPVLTLEPKGAKQEINYSSMSLKDEAALAPGFRKRTRTPLLTLIDLAKRSASTLFNEFEFASDS